jgi:hypothetical protein
VQALRRRLAGLARSRLDAELVDLDVPCAHRGREATEQAMTEMHDRGQAGAVADRFGDRGEPARNPAIQLVVVERLVVRLMQLPADRAVRGGGEDRVAATAVTASVGHVGVEVELVPGCGKLTPVGQPADRG